jgi:hypothetical protein
MARAFCLGDDEGAGAGPGAGAVRVCVGGFAGPGRCGCFVFGCVPGCVFGCLPGAVVGCRVGDGLLPDGLPADGLPDPDWPVPTVWLPPELPVPCPDP